MVDISALDYTEEEIEDIMGAMAEAGQGLQYDDEQGLIKQTRMGPNPYDHATSFSESNVTVNPSAAWVRDGSITLNKPNESWYVSLNPPNLGSESASTTMDFTGKATLDAGISVGPYTTWELFIDGTSVHGPTYQSGYKHDISDIGGPRDVKVVAENTRDDGYQGDADGDIDTTGQTTIEGDAVVEWTEPENIYKWGVLSYTATPDGESVEVYAVYDEGDGSGWQRANGGDPIGRNYSIGDDPDISPSDAVAVEVVLSRSDTSNNPRLDTAVRSWVL